MGEKLFVGPINRGYRNDRTAFVIDNDNFPTLVNAYQWRGRIKRKRGTSLLGRLTRFFNSLNTAYSSVSTITLSGGGAGNLLTGFSLQTNGNIVPGSVTITNGGNNYTDPAMDGTLSPSGSINYATGAIVIVAQAGNAVSAVFRYYPDLPVMGLEDLAPVFTDFPGTLGFDTVYSYNISPASPYNIYDVSFYKNLATATYTSYVQKTSWTPTTWNGQTYQQFWTVNYQGAFWATNGINVPFNTTNIGMQFKPILTVNNITSGPPAIARLTLDVSGGAHNLVKGDFLFINEVVTTTGINFQTGYVVSNDPQNANFVDVEFPNATITTNGTGGIAQYLTNISDKTKDCLRWYDGDPTNGNATTPVLTVGKGWVNFMPPLSEFAYSVAGLPAAIYYLVGARMIIPFKDRLLFLGPVVQTSSGSPIYLQDTIIYSQNGTPYYTCSYTNTPSSTADTPTSPTNVFFPILIPTNQTATPSSYFEDQTGFGGNITVGVDQPIITASSNEDALILGFSTIQTRLIYTGNDIIPFNSFLINSELGSSSTFSAINLDLGVITRGSRGYIMTGQTETRRIDLDIPDQVFQIKLTSNGNERFCAQRDFINEWIYFTYNSNEVAWVYPNQTLLYNYRDDTYAIFNESYTTYGQFKRQTGLTWATLAADLTWRTWNSPWNSGDSTLLQPEVIAGNQQGFVLFKESFNTSEGTSLYIRSITNSTVTAPSHNLNNGDYIVISGAIGTVASAVNGNIFSVANVTTDTFTLNPNITAGLTYLGRGVITKMYVPFIQTRQFPSAWGSGRKTRIGNQQYLLTTTNNGQITVQIYLSQSDDSPFNDGTIVPNPYALNNALIYSQVVYTCLESSNIGLTPANTNLQMISYINPTGTDASTPQSQIWHRMNTSLIGDTVQLGFTLSDDQMRDVNFSNQFSEIELHSFILDVSPSQMLC